MIVVAFQNMICFFKQKIFDFVNFNFHPIALCEGANPFFLQCYTLRNVKRYFIDNRSFCTISHPVGVSPVSFQ